MKKLTAFLCAMFVLTFGSAVFANGTEDMLGGKQDLVIMGSVKDITGEEITITVDHVLGRNGSELVGTDINVKKFSYTYCEEHSTSDFRNPIISDNIVISLNGNDDGTYQVANSAYKVNSNEYASCKIIMLDGTDDDACVQQMQKVTCYVRANGMVSDFGFDSEGRIYAVYPQSPEQCLHLVHEDGTAVNPEEAQEPIPVVGDDSESKEKEASADKRGIYALVIIAGGAIVGLIIAFAIRMRREIKTKN